MKCSRCQQTKDESELIVHARRYRKRSEDFYIVWYCHTCQNTRIKDYNQRKKEPMVVDENWIKGARLSNDRLMAKYAN